MCQISLAIHRIALHQQESISAIWTLTHLEAKMQPVAKLRIAKSHRRNTKLGTIWFQMVAGIRTKCQIFAQERPPYGDFFQRDVSIRAPPGETH